jgi:hypothetical protein
LSPLRLPPRKPEYSPTKVIDGRKHTGTLLFTKVTPSNPEANTSLSFV